MEIDNVLISKEDFMKYERLRKSGIINMLDIESGMSYTGLSYAAYCKIIKRYKIYAEQWLNN